MTTMKLFDPSNWYWIADDGRIFSSARGYNVTADDDGYEAFVASVGAAPIWPRDTVGGQTEQSLDAALAPYGVGRTLIGYAAQKRWEKESGGLTVSGIPIATDDRSKQMILGARIAADADAGFTTQWVGEDGSVYGLNAAQVIGISNAVLAHVQNCFAIFAEVSADIASGEITYREQIDAAFE